MLEVLIEAWVSVLDSNMMSIYDDHVRRSYMMITDDDIITCDDHIG